MWCGQSFCKSLSETTWLRGLASPVDSGRGCVAGGLSNRAACQYYLTVSYCIYTHVPRWVDSGCPNLCCVLVVCRLAVRQVGTEGFHLDCHLDQAYCCVKHHDLAISQKGDSFIIKRHECMSQCPTTLHAETTRRPPQRKTARVPTVQLRSYESKTKASQEPS